MRRALFSTATAAASPGIVTLSTLSASLLAALSTSRGPLPRSRAWCCSASSLSLCSASCRLFPADAPPADRGLVLGPLGSSSGVGMARTSSQV